MCCAYSSAFRKGKGLSVTTEYLVACVLNILILSVGSSIAHIKAFHWVIQRKSRYLSVEPQ